MIDGGVTRPSASWHPTQAMSLLGSNLASLLWTTQVLFRFRALDGTASVDDVYVDPWVIR